MAETKFGDRTIRDITLTLLNSTHKETNTPPYNDLRTDIIYTCFSLLLSERCDIFKPYITSVNWKQGPFGVSALAKRIINKFRKTGVESRTDHLLTRYRVTDLIWVGVFKGYNEETYISLPNDPKREAKGQYALAAANQHMIIRHWGCSMESELRRTTNSFFKAIGEWQEHETEWVTEIDAFLESNAKKEKIDKIKKATDLGVIGLRMEQEGIEFEYSHEKSWTDILVEVPGMPTRTCVRFAVRNNNMLTDLENGIAFVRATRQLAAGGCTNFSVASSNYTHLKKWDGGSRS